MTQNSKQNVAGFFVRFLQTVATEISANPAYTIPSLQDITEKQFCYDGINLDHNTEVKAYPQQDDPES